MHIRLCLSKVHKLDSVRYKSHLMYKKNLLPKIRLCSAQSLNNYATTVQTVGRVLCASIYEYKSRSFCTIYIICMYVRVWVGGCTMHVKKFAWRKKRNVVHFFGAAGRGMKAKKNSLDSLPGPGNVSRFAGFSPRKTTHYLRVRQAATDDER